MRLLCCLMVYVVGISIGCKSQPKEDDKYTFEQWQNESFDNIRLLPRYGYVIKSPEQLAADKEFIAETKSQDNFKNLRAASDNMVKLGFQYFYEGNLKVAMYRFNQAYLLDSTNTDDYWGYGSVYMQLGKLDLAEHQYRTGLSKDSLNHHLWTDLGTVYTIRSDENDDSSMLDTARQLFETSYRIEPKDVNTVYKLSVNYYMKGDCAKAKKLYDECVALGGQPIAEAYKKVIEENCK